MTLYAVLGDGEMPAKEVAKQLDDLWRQAEEKDTDFWFVMEGKANPSATDLDIVSFFNKGGIHYALMVPAGVTVPDEYTDVAEYIDVPSVDGPTVVEVLNVLKASEDEGGEDAVVLALFSDISGDSTSDDVLIAQLTATITAGFKAYALNDAMEEIELRTEAAVELPEDAVKPKVDEPVVEDVPAPDPDAEPLPLDKTYLSGLTAAELKELCKGMGIPYTTKAEAIAAILAVQDTEQTDTFTAASDSAVSEGADMEDAESDFVEVDGEVYPTGDIILDAPAAEATAYQATVIAGEEHPLAVHPIGTGPAPSVPNLEDPLVKEDIRTSGVTKDKVHAYEVQYSYLPKAKNGQRTYRSNHKLLVISTNIIRATAIIMMKHQDEDCQVHQIVQRSHDKVMIDSAIFGED